jgi:hypothetical protein
MKTQAWGWLAAAVVAAGLNASYHDGGLQWVHDAVDQVKHNTGAVMALATGRADQFVAEAQLVAARRDAAPCPFAAAVAEARSISPREFKIHRMEVISARQQAELARLQANRTRMEAELAQLHIPAVTFNPVVVQAPRISCPRVRVNLPRIPAMRMREVHLKGAGFGSV